MIRAALTLILTLVLAALTCVLTLADGAERSLADPDTTMHIVDDAGVRQGVVDLAEELLAREVARNPQLGGVTRPELGAVIDDVLAKEWFDPTFRRCYTTLLGVVEASPATAIIDLHPLKADLRLALADLRERADKTCVKLAGQAECASSRPASRGIQTYADRARLVIDNTEDQVDLAALLTHDGHDESKTAEMRRWIANAPQARWLGLGALGLVLVLILLINLGSGRRVFASLGFALAVSVIFSFVVDLGAAGRVRAEIENRITAAKEWRETDPLVARMVPPVMARFAGELVDRAAIAARTTLLIMGVAGAVFIAGALVMRGQPE